MIAFYDTKPYDRQFFRAAQDSDKLPWIYHDFRLSSATVKSALGATAVCVFVNDRLDAPCLQELARMGVRQIALRCAGFNQVDLPVARELGFQVVRVPAYSPYAVAEHTVALLLTLNRQIHRAYNRVREHNFTLSGLVGFDLHGRTAGLVGTGKIGRVTAQILRGFGMQVFVHDPMPDENWARACGVEYVPLEPLFRKSHVVSLHLPLTPETRHLINSQTLDWMLPGAFLVNTSRGKLVDTQALLVALKSGRLGGVALDVYEEEEGVFFEDYSGQVLQDDELSRLLTFPNVLVTSHQAFLTKDALSEIARVTVTNLLRFRDGQPPLPDTDVLASLP